tara:strand:- start:1132 stop:1398 length:267 start_codon:yes stop_codon:yes gene_type:complete
MKELTMNEMEEVNGGVGPIGALIGAVVGGVSQGLNGGSIGWGIFFGGVSGFTGGMAGAAFSAGRYGIAAANTARSIGTGVLAGADLDQ